jgi:polyferredoxin
LNAKSWRRLRIASQIIFLLLFLFLFWMAQRLTLYPILSSLFFYLDPLAVSIIAISTRTVVLAFNLALLSVVLTLVFGRAWCGWICPLGTILEWIKPARRGKNQNMPPESLRRIKYVLLLVVMIAGALGSQFLFFLDPITLLNRFLSQSAWPAVQSLVYNAEAYLYRFESLWNILDKIHAFLVYPVFQERVSLFYLAVPTLLLFVLLLGLNWVAERFWCRYLCPLGGLLGFLSRFSLLRRKVVDSCISCQACARVCPTGTISPKDFQSDPAECIVCYDCITVCTLSANHFEWQFKAWNPAAKKAYDPGRREVLLGLGAAVGGVALAGAEPITHRQPAILIRPPGATEESIASECIRCSLCINVCPTQGLQASILEGGWQNLFTPQLVPRLGYCDYNCQACTQVCPTEAIPSMNLEEKRSTAIGLARVDRNRCLPWAYNTPCIVCEEACPLPDKAIKLQVDQVLDLGGDTITLQRPIVQKENCIGCGICEYQCPVGGEAAIRVYTPTPFIPTNYSTG